MDEHPAMALREKKDSLDPRRDGPREARATPTRVVTAGHTGAGMAAAVLRLGRLPGVDRPALAVQMVDRRRAARPPRHRREPRLEPARTSPSTPGWARSSPSACSASRRRASRSSRSARRRARATLRIQQATELLDADRPATSSATSRARTSTTHLADVVVCDAVARQRRDQVLRGPVDLHLRPVPGRVPRLAPGPARRTCCCGPGSRRIRQVFDYERVGGSPLLGVKGTVIITHGRARRRMIGVRRRRRGDDGPDPRPGADRRGAPPARGAEPAAAGSRRTTAGRPRRRWSPPRERPRPDRRQGRRSTRWSGSPRSRSRASPASPAAARPGARSSPGRAVVDQHSPATASASGLDRRPARPGARPARRARSGRPSAPPSSGCSASGSSRSRSRSMASGADRAASRASAGRYGPRLPDRPAPRPRARSSRPTSASAPPTRSSSATSPRPRATRGPPTLARQLVGGGRRAPRHDRRQIIERSPPSIRSSRWPEWTARCSVAPSVRCYTRRRRPGWRSPSGSSWHGPTVETRCGA